jgi:FixJ family two-component response regulator
MRIADSQMPLMTGDELQARLLASGRAFPIIS